MSKLRKRLSKWFINTAKKLDEDTVYDNCTISIPPSPPSPLRNDAIIMYDRYHVDKIHAQYQISNTMFDTYRKMDGYDGFIEERIPEILAREIAEEIMKVHKDEIKKTQLELMDGPLYSLDVYVCRPTKKETI